MKLGWMTAIACVVSGAAEAAPQGPMLTLNTNSDAKYEVWCNVDPLSGEASTRYLEQARPSFTSTNVRRASCQYKTGSAPVSISLSGDAWACPFTVSADGKCEQVLARASFGQFEVRRKTH